jgi:hypothetical protein
LKTKESSEQLKETRKNYKKLEHANKSLKNKKQTKLTKKTRENNKGLKKKTLLGRRRGAPSKSFHSTCLSVIV